MNHLRLFESFNKVDIHNICKIYHIRNYTINENGYIDANGNVNLNDMKLTKLPLKFNEINGNFWCYFNYDLASLDGCPKYIGGNFDCSYCHITTFEHFPKHIGGDFNCNNNPIFEIWKLFGDASKIELFNDMDIIQDGVVILDRLNYFLEEIGRPTVKFVNGYKYI